MSLCLKRTRTRMDFMKTVPEYFSLMLISPMILFGMQAQLDLKVCYHTFIDHRGNSNFPTFAVGGAGHHTYNKG